MVSFKTRSSHVRVYESCNRKWFLNEIAGEPDPETYAKTFGTAAHWQREQWLKTARMPDDSKPGQAARRGLGYLPAPGGGLSIEEKIEEVINLGPGVDVIYYSTPDLIDLRELRLLLPSKHGALRLYDHKFTGSLKYAKAEDELRRDVSSVFYARRTKRVLEGRDEYLGKIPSRWLYNEREGSGVLPVDFVITNADLNTRWDMTLSSVKVMRSLAEQGPLPSELPDGKVDYPAQRAAYKRGGHLPWQDVTPNYDACSAYGGCPFRARCAMAKVRSAHVGRKETEMGLLDDLKNKAGIGGAKPLIENLREGQPLGSKVAPPSAPANAPAKASMEQRTAAAAASLPPKPTVPSPLPAAGTLAKLLQRSGVGLPAQAPPSQPEPNPVLAPAIADPEAVETDPMDPETAPLEAEGEMDASPSAPAEGMSFGIVPPEAPAPDLQKNTVEKRAKKKREKKIEIDGTATAQVVQATAGLGSPEQILESGETLAEAIQQTVAPRASVAPTGTLLERITRLEQVTIDGGCDTSLADRVGALEDRIAGLERLIGG